ncbi:MAG: MarR family EPS-associated transcriptional regulator [Pseudomonadales bacterium]|nr:MarR family EPS-associated transcriptional regulator [Pseudomonadales bacterium]MCP5343535.1 MarR family EPS-associated transcriptional regulator [Pseudomonadales bacterium]
MLSEDADYYILRKLEAQPQITQRELAQELGISLGKVNYCLQALIEKGMVKARNFSNNPNKKGYLYMLTPAGLENKAAITHRFLKRKMVEYETLSREIEALQQDLSNAEQGASK